MEYSFSLMVNADKAAGKSIDPTWHGQWAMSDEGINNASNRDTVEMLLIYSLGRSDILPVDDFGVREGYRRLKGLEKAPTPAQMRSLGGAWRPFRTVAAWYLWRA